MRYQINLYLEAKKFFNIQVFTAFKIKVDFSFIIILYDDMRVEKIIFKITYILDIFLQIF